MMLLISKFISYVGLGLTILPSLLVLMGKMDTDTHKMLMVIGMVSWFIGAWFWIYRKKDVPKEGS